MIVQMTKRGQADMGTGAASDSQRKRIQQERSSLLIVLGNCSLALTMISLGMGGALPHAVVIAGAVSLVANLVAAGVVVWGIRKSGFAVIRYGRHGV